MVEGPTAILQRAERLLDHNCSGVLRNFDQSLARDANLRAGGGESVESLHDEKKVGVGSGLSIRYLYRCLLVAMLFESGNAAPYVQSSEATCILQLHPTI